MGCAGHCSRLHQSRQRAAARSDPVDTRWGGGTLLEMGTYFQTVVGPLTRKSRQRSWRATALLAWARRSPFLESECSCAGSVSSSCTNADRTSPVIQSWHHSTKLDGEAVFADPAGHPFCFVKRPGWAEPSATDRQQYRLIALTPRQRKEALVRSTPFRWSR